MPVLSPIGEAVHAALRKLDIAAQAVVLRVDATMLDFDVYAQLVSNDTDFLQRHHYLEPVWFTDGPTGDDGFVIQGTFVLPAESVIFTDGTNGDNGLVIFLPISMGSETVTFTEDAYSQAFAISNTEYVTLADYSVQYLLAFNRDEQVIFSDMSIAWASIYEWDESVLVSDSLVTLGGNTVALSESVTISEVVLGANSVILGDAWGVFESWFTTLASPIISDTVTWTDTLVVSVVAATDSRPGAFITGSALLGSPS